MSADPRPSRTALHPGCYVCERTAAQDRADWEQVWQDASWRVAMAFDSSLPGWLVLVPRRHVSGLQELTPVESETLGRLLRDASIALVRATTCVKTYVMLFAEAEGFAHLHVHLVPRMAQQPADRKGPRVFGYLGADEGARVPEAERDALTAELRSAWPGLPSN